MKTRAAVAVEAGKPLEIMEVDLDGPRSGEVLVEIKATGICHTDEFTLSGNDPEGLFPAILGHEGAGVVKEVGKGVTSLKEGDHVIPLYTPECRECEYCLHPKTNLCQAIRTTQGQGVMPDGTSRFSIKGKPILHYMGTSTFSNYTVVPEIALAKVNKSAPFDKICYIGCGVTTGIGAVINTAKASAGCNAVVFGLGGIGLNVIQGLRMIGANMIVGVDMNNKKEAWGKKFGMTHFVNPSKIKGDLVNHIVELTGGGADYSFECIGNVNVMRQALECAHKGWGESIIIGVAGAGQEIATVSQSGTSIVVAGDLTSANLWIGEQYEFLFQFSQQFIQLADSSGSRISVREGRLQIRNWNVSFNDTGFFTTEVVPVGRSTSTSAFTGTTTGTGALGVVNLSDGDYTFAVQSENDKLTITLKNNSHLPSNFINANWQGYYVTASSRA